MNEPMFFQKTKDLGETLVAERLSTSERKLESGTLDMVYENREVVRIDEPVLRRAGEEVVWVIHDELVERAAIGHQDCDRGACPSTGATRPLPGGCNRSRVTGKNGHVQITDVDPELEGVGGDHAEYGAVSETLFDLPALLRKITAAVATDEIFVGSLFLENLLQIGD
jgi:hypothetical protein